MGVDNGFSSSLPYKVYTAKITQETTSAPTAVVLQNTLDFTPVWSRFAEGVYRLTLSGAFPDIEKVFCLALDQTGVNGDLGSFKINNSTSTSNYLEFNSFLGGTLSDGILDGVSLEIRVYP